MIAKLRQDGAKGWNDEESLLKAQDAEDLKNRLSNYGFHLSQRESEVLMEVIRGKSNKEIAKTLYISYRTVEKHMENILSKLCLKHRTEVLTFVNHCKAKD